MSEWTLTTPLILRCQDWRICQRQPHRFDLAGQRAFRHETTGTFFASAVSRNAATSFIHDFVSKSAAHVSSGSIRYTPTVKSAALPDALPARCERSISSPTETNSWSPETNWYDWLSARRNDVTRSQPGKQRSFARRRFRPVSGHRRSSPRRRTEVQTPRRAH